MKVYQVLNGSGNPASGEFDNMAIFESRKTARRWKDYLDLIEGVVDKTKSEYTIRAMNLSCQKKYYPIVRGGEGMTCKLIIKSLHDAQAECTCGGWYMACTGERNRAHIEEEYRKHIKGGDRYG